MPEAYPARLIITTFVSQLRIIIHRSVSAPYSNMVIRPTSYWVLPTSQLVRVLTPDLSPTPLESGCSCNDNRPSMWCATMSDCSLCSSSERVWLRDKSSSQLPCKSNLWASQKYSVQIKQDCETNQIVIKNYSTAIGSTSLSWAVRILKIRNI